MKNIWQGWRITGGFLLTFFLITIVSLSILGALIFGTTFNIRGVFFPTGTLESVDTIDWAAMQELGGWGELLDQDAHVIQRFGDPQERVDRYTLDQLSLFTSNEENQYTRLAYSLPDGQTLVLAFPSENVSNLPTIQLNRIGNNQQRISWLIALWLLAYIFVTILLGRRLQRRVAKELQAQHQAEQEARMQVFRGLTHDIKTPLAAMMAYTKALVDGQTPVEERDAFLKTIYHQGEVLNSRVSSLLTVTSLDAQVTTTALETTDILAATREALDDLARSFKFQGFEIIQHESLNGSFTVPGKAEIWKRCVENIVTNAARHNPDGVQVTVRWEAEKKQLVFEDNGKGIPPEKIDLVLMPFVKGDDSRSDHSLSGIGLYVTQQLLEQLGWSLSLANRPSGGLSVAFTYLLPQKK